VAVRLITQKSIRLKDGDLDILGPLSPAVSEVKVYGPPYSKSAIVDDREVLIVFSRVDGGVPDEDNVIAIWIPNTSVASYWASVFNAVWNV
jgi:hypothetical protein